MRLLTEEPQKLAEADLIRMQRGQCAACRSPLPPPVKQSGFLGGRSAATVRNTPTQYEPAYLICFTCTSEIKQEVLGCGGPELVSPSCGSPTPAPGAFKYNCQLGHSIASQSSLYFT